MRKPLFAAIAFAAVAAPAMAGHVLPGLWETVVKRQNDQAAMAMQNLPPSVRDKLKAQGIDINGGAMTVRICISQAMADRDDVDANKIQNCKVVLSKFAGNKRIADVTCQMGGTSIRSHSEFTFESPRHYFGTVTADNASGGESSHTEMQIDARYLGADCGSVKPYLK